MEAEKPWAKLRKLTRIDPRRRREENPEKQTNETEHSSLHAARKSDFTSTWQ
jgi:hypothetical protein